MRLRCKVLLAAVLAATLLALSSSAPAKTAGYCLECHAARYPQDSGMPGVGLDRSVYLAKLEPCPGLRARAEDTYFTESRMVKIREMLRTMNREGWNTDSLETRVGNTGEAFSQLKNRNLQSVEEFSGEASSLRSALQKVYDQTVHARAESDRRWLIGIGALCFLGLFILLGVGFQKLSRMGKIGLLLLLMNGTLLLSACSPAPSEPAKKSAAQESLEQSLSVATRAAGRVEEGFHQSILVAQLARDWSQVDPSAAEKAFHLAWKMAIAGTEESVKLRSFQERISRWPDRSAAVKEKVDYDTVLDLRDESRNADSRSWGLRAVAEEWLRANEKNGRQALEFATQKAMEIKDPEIRDRDFMSLAEAWNPIDENRGSEVSHFITDPFWKSLSLTRLALSGRSRDKAGNLLREAWKTAQSVQPGYSRAQVRMRIAATAARIFPGDKKYWAEQAMADILKLENPKLKEAALGEMILLWGAVDGEMAEGWAEGMAPEQAEARAYAFLSLSLRPGISPEKTKALMQKTLEAAMRIPDSFESQKIMSLIGKGLVKVDPQAALLLLPQIADPFFRSEILEQMAELFSSANPRKALELAEKIPVEAWRARVTTRIIGQGAEKDRQKVLSLYRETLQAAQTIPDPYARALTLLELGKEWGGLERGKESAVWEMALKAGEGISNPPDRAEILEILAADWKSSDPARAQALAGRTEASVIGVRKTLAEVRLWAKTDPARAQRWAEAIPPSFPYEKGQALKEVASNWKKFQPKPALSMMDKALQQVFSMPEGGKKRKLLRDLIAEAASLDPDLTLRWIGRVPESSSRDLLYKEAGNSWAGEEPMKAMKAAEEISESSLRLSLIQKAAESAAKKPAQGKTEEPLYAALASWGRGREAAKREERQAVPFYQKALEEIERLKDRREKAYLLGGLAGDWAGIDEKQARQVAEKIGAEEFGEPYSYALLQIAAQYRKWSRKEAEASFAQTLSAAEKISGPYLRAQRLLQVAQEWKTINPGKGKEVLARALEEAGKSGTVPQDSILLQVLLTQAGWQPGESVSTAKNANSPAMRARVLLEGAKVLKAESIDEKIKSLEKALLLAQREKNYRLMAEVAVSWFSLVPQKGLEIQGQVEPRDLRVRTLRRMAHSTVFPLEREGRRLLDQASEDASKAEGTTEKLQLLREIASDWAAIDKERAKATYLKAYQIAEREFLSNPQLRD